MKQGHQGPSQGRKNKQLAPTFSVIYQWFIEFWDQLLAIINKKMISSLGQVWVGIWVQYHSFDLWKVLSLLATWSLWARI